MREIKLRAWLKAESVMCTVDLLRFDTGAFLIGAEPSADQIIVGMNLKVKALENGRFCNNGEFELMQFTGLIDSSDNDIYEGDIVEVENEYPVITRCEFDHGQFLLLDNADGSWTRQLYYERRRLKVIGNIYENPDLL